MFSAPAPRFQYSITPLLNYFNSAPLIFARLAPKIAAWDTKFI
jgi:hypothetical protein